MGKLVQSCDIQLDLLTRIGTLMERWERQRWVRERGGGERKGGGGG